jgi:hypothetical protein
MLVVADTSPINYGIQTELMTTQDISGHNAQERIHDHGPLSS